METDGQKGGLISCYIFQVKPTNQSVPYTFIPLYATTRGQHLVVVQRHTKDFTSFSLFVRNPSKVHRGGLILSYCLLSVAKFFYKNVCYFVFIFLLMMPQTLKSKHMIVKLKYTELVLSALDVPACFTGVCPPCQTIEAVQFTPQPTRCRSNIRQQLTGCI